MIKKDFFWTACAVFLCLRAAAYGQTHTSVPLDDNAYYLLEQAELRGLCSPLPRSRPYSRAQVTRLVNEILSAEGAALSAKERAALEGIRKELRYDTGFDAKRLAYHAEREVAGTYVSSSLGMGLSSLDSIAFLNGTFEAATDNHLRAYISGDIGRFFSYSADAALVIAYLPRPYLGLYQINYEDPSGAALTEELYGTPKAFLPYSYRRSWEGSAGYFNSLDAAGHRGWFDEPGMSFSSSPEIDGAFLDGIAGLRFGRIRHDWGGGVSGGSLFLNGAAQPFTAIELYVRPFDWFGVSTLTGVLEYFNSNGIKDSAKTSQNAFSITMFEFSYKQYLSLNAGTSVVWPKRFELGYMFPLINDFFYQNDIGDFDNLAIFLDVGFSYPGLGRLWLSVFADEIQIESGMFERDRTMFAAQAGIIVPLPRLPFASLKISYTKIEPYCYTHPKLEVPWLNGEVEQAYVNQGESLGYYLPPNSDEILVRYEQFFTPESRGHFQYQMIRHGAVTGGHAVDGSSFLSELAGDRSTMKKFFLHDGAYQWQHIFQTGLKHRFSKLPLELSGIVGLVYSYFTDITEGDARDNTWHPNKIIDTAEYPAALNVFFTVSARIFPRL